MKSTEQVPELLEVVAGNLVSVEEGIAALGSHKASLQRSADQAKLQISESVEKGLSQLRAREKHLLRQVDLATMHQNTEVNVTQAQLLQHKGALSVTRTLLDNCPSPSKPCDNIGCSNQDMSYNIASTINSMPHQDVDWLLSHAGKLVTAPLLSVNTDDSDLSYSIESFGKVEVAVPLSHTDLLPHSLEEYGDVEHHVLHKSVQPELSSPGPIDLRKPYILAAKNKKALHPPSNVSNTNKEELMKWLNQIDLANLKESCPEIEECCNDNMCVRNSCQANELCDSFSKCVMSGDCKKNALEKIHQTNEWHIKQVSATLDPSRKRSLSDANESGRLVLNHMNSILKSDNENWLSGIKREQSGEYKKMKVSHSPSRAVDGILYKPPNVNWIQPSENAAPKTEDFQPEDKIYDNITAWLLRGKPVPKEALSHKSLSKSAKTKSQTSLWDYYGESEENLKEKIEKLCIDDNQLSDLEVKQQWLIKNSSDVRENNKNVTKRMLDPMENCEWLSNTSMSSFTIISDSDSRYPTKDWLL